MTALNRNHFAVVAGILLTAFGLRYYISFFSGLGWYNTDTYIYFDMAAAIRGGYPRSAVSNGYPLVIALLQSMLPSLTPVLLISLNIILSTAVVYFVIEVAAVLSSRIEIGYLAGLAATVYPNQINYVRQLMTETPTAFALTLGLWLLVRKRYFTAGLILYVAMLLRSSLLPVLPALFICLFPTGAGTKKALRFTAGIALGCLLYYSLLASGVVRPASNVNENLLISISSDSRNVNFTPKSFSADETAHPLRTYLNFAHTHFPVYLKQRLYSLQELWGWPADGNPPRSLTAKLLIALRLPMLILGMIGLFRHRTDIRCYWLAIPILLVTALHTAFFSTPRFTYVIEPPLIVLAALAFEPILRAFLPRKSVADGQS